jgi:hypothetical protein
VSSREPLGGCPLGPQTGAGVVPSRSKLSFTISSYVQRVGQSKVVGTAVGKVWKSHLYNQLDLFLGGVLRALLIFWRVNLNTGHIQVEPS